jgi:hypothetical protein
VCLAVLGFVLVFVVRAQDTKKPDPAEPGLKKKDGPKEDKVPKKGKAEDPKKDDGKDDEVPKLERLPGQEERDGPREKPEEIVARIKKNLAESEERLEKKDPGKDTRNIQDKIVKDLDELIKQQKDQQNQSGSSSGSASKSGKSGKGSSGQNNSGKNTGGKNTGGKNSGASAGKEKKPSTDKQAGNKGKGQDPKKTAGGSKGQQGKGKNTIADLYKDIWGHLPLSRRQEMDAYSRERFMPRYEDLLREYYRTIAEQNRRKEGD